MASIYEIDYKFDSEWRDDGWRTGLVCVYETGTPSGDNLQHALDLANEDDDWSGVDKLLTTMFDLKDEDITSGITLIDLPHIELNDEEEWKAKNGQALSFNVKEDKVLLIKSNSLIAVYKRKNENTFVPERGLF